MASDLTSVVELPSAGEWLIAAALLLPGFIFVQARERLVASPRRDFSKSFVEFFAYSAMNYVLFAWFIQPRFSRWSHLEFYVWEYAALLAIALTAPVLLAVIQVRTSHWQLLERLAGITGSRRLLEPTAWDYFFGQQDNPAWVLVRLRNGTTVGGLFDNQSFASRYPEPPTLYLAKQYRLSKDGRLTTPVEGGKGVLISGEDIHLLEFWDVQS